MHQQVELNLECVIRRITNKTVWYLHSTDTEINKCIWTRRFQKAYLFKNEADATDFMKFYMNEERMKECDLFNEYQTWSI